MAEVILEGTFDWIKTDPNRPEVYDSPDGKKKKSWSAIIRPTPASLEIIREMAGEGIKNRVKKDDKGWLVKFSCPVEKTNKAGKVTETFTAPRVVDSEGKPITGLVANNAKGFMKVDLYEHNIQGGGTSKAARFLGLKLTEWKPYGSPEDTGAVSNASAAPPANFF